MTDIGTIKINTWQFDLPHPETGDLLGLRLTLRPHDDETYTAAAKKLADKKMQLERRGKTMSADQLIEESKKLTAARIGGWEWTDDGEGTLEGGRPEFSPGLARKLIEPASIRKVIDDEVALHEGFS